MPPSPATLIFPGWPTINRHLWTQPTPLLCSCWILLFLLYLSHCPCADTLVQCHRQRGFFCYLEHFLASCSLLEAVKVACKSCIARRLHQLHVLLSPQLIACSQLYMDITNDIQMIQMMGLVLKCCIYIVVFSPLLFSFRGSLCMKNIY